LELNEIYADIQEDLTKVKSMLASLSDVDFPWLSKQLGYVVANTGKGMRPAMTLIAGKFYDYDLTYLMPMAVSVELMHTSTLVHDDAIDNSPTRRGQPTIYNVWGEDIAILLGDYLFAKAAEFVSDTKTPRVVKLFAQTLAIISSGEINQYLGAYNIDQTREDYYKRISGKTASLFALATTSGAILSKAPEPSVDILHDYGWNLGTAFQIIDDILDFTSDEETLGKPVGSDLAQGTFTLPAMMLLERYPVNNPIKSTFENKDKESLAKAIEMITNSSIMEDCYKIATEYRDKACSKLGQLPDKPARTHLEALADYVISRKI